MNLGLFGINTAYASTQPASARKTGTKKGPFRGLKQSKGDAVLYQVRTSAMPTV